MKPEELLALTGMDRATFEALDHAQLVELLCRFQAVVIEQAERLAMNSTNSSRPPSSDPPFGGGGNPGGVSAAGAKGSPASASVPATKEPASGRRKPGKQPGAKGKWRDEPLKTERSQSHWPCTCARCGTPLELWDAVVGTAEAFPVFELERLGGGIRIACVLHRYEVVRCACGHETAARPGLGVLSFQEGRRRDLLVSERCLIGPSLAAFITALAIRHHQSRRRIREFLLSWFGVALSVGSIDRCLREVGVACEPIVEDLLEEVRASGVIHADETPWWQGVLGRWLWVVLSATTAVFHIGSRRHEEIRDLLGDAILGWLVTDPLAVTLKPPVTAQQRRELRKALGLDTGGRWSGTRPARPTIPSRCGSSSSSSCGTASTWTRPSVPRASPAAAGSMCSPRCTGGTRSPSGTG